MNAGAFVAMDQEEWRGGAVPVIQFLADKGAKLDVYNKKRWTPLFAAEGVVYASSGIRRYRATKKFTNKARRLQSISANGSISSRSA